MKISNIFLLLVLLFYASVLFCRYVCWTAYLMRHHGKSGHMEPVPLPGSPFSHYYSQEASDEGIIIETNVAVKEVSTTNIFTVSWAVFNIILI
jgi:hypothetical protein